MIAQESAGLLGSPFIDQFESMYLETNLQLVGSIGRQAIMNAYSADRQPLSVIRPNGEYRDIDALDHMSSHGVMPDAAQAPLKLDLQCNKWVRHEANGTWITFPGDLSVAESVRPEVFTPAVRVLGDTTLRTYTAATQQRINRLCAFERPKDKTAFREYDDFVAELGQYSSATEADRPLPKEFYEPFVRFEQAIKEKHKGYLMACYAGVVVSSLPHPLRDAARWLGGPVKHHYLA